MSQVSSSRFRAPGAGLWDRDAAHGGEVMTRFFDALSRPALHAGLSRGFALAGALVEGFDEHAIGGHWYRRVRLVGVPSPPTWGEGPPKPYAGALPPKLLFKALVALHPGLRARTRRAAEVFETKAWREIARSWRERLRPDALGVNRRLQSFDVGSANDDALRSHLVEVCRAFEIGFEQHLAHAPMAAVAVGDFLAHAQRWTGASLAECLAAVSGTSPASTEPIVLARAVGEAIRAAEGAAEIAGDATRSAAERIEALRAMSSTIARALDAWLDDHGHRPFSGLDLDAEMLVERPEIVLTTALAPPVTLGGAARAADVGAELRARTPSRERARFDELLEEARLMYGVRDDDVGILVVWRLGLVRRALVAVAERLLARGRLHAIADLMESTPAEVSLLVGVGVGVGGGGPAADELAARRARRLELSSVDAPETLGEELPIPPLDWFPPAVARAMTASSTYMESLGRVVPREARSLDAPIVVGAGASRGVHVGRVRILRDASVFERIEAGDVLVAETTSPGINVVLPLIGAIVTDRGGLLCHAAIVSRELGIPAVVGAGHATRTLMEGAWVEVDGTRGEVRVVPEPAHVARPRRRASVVAPARSACTVDEGPGEIVPLPSALDADRFGGKASALARALGAGIDVPMGLALDVAKVLRVVAGERIDTTRLRVPLAVRSSAIGEDGARASFAGQHLSVLGVTTPEALHEAIVSVHASVSSPGALAYRAQMGITELPRMAVIVQEMVSAEVAGVSFSRRGTRVIESVRGLGEALVSGEVTPERVELGAAGEVIRRAHVRDAPMLDPTQLGALGALAQSCDALFGAPQDLEWAFAAGRLHLLQSRAVTSDDF